MNNLWHSLFSKLPKPYTMAKYFGFFYFMSLIKKQMKEFVNWNELDYICQPGRRDPQWRWPEHPWWIHDTSRKASQTKSSRPGSTWGSWSRDRTCRPCRTRRRLRPCRSWSYRCSRPSRWRHSKERWPPVQEKGKFNKLWMWKNFHKLLLLIGVLQEQKIIFKGERFYFF